MFWGVSWETLDPIGETQKKKKASLHVPLHLNKIIKCFHCCRSAHVHSHLRFARSSMAWRLNEETAIWGCEIQIRLVIRPEPVSLEFDFHSYEHKDKVDVNHGKPYTCSADVSNGRLDGMHHSYCGSYCAENVFSTLGRTGKIGHVGYLFSVHGLYGDVFEDSRMWSVLCS